MLQHLPVESFSIERLLFLIPQSYKNFPKLINVNIYSCPTGISSWYGKGSSCHFYNK
ncbi:MAG: hypothetical protein H6Q17_2612 [Bacteroidetes bacterium]|jgi:hypothetical protein|nr:hypothetical protein [Bacteroidota bacterium]